MPITAQANGSNGTVECVIFAQEPQNPTLTSSVAFTLTGNGGVSGQYMVTVDAGNFNNGTVTFQSIGGTTYAVWGAADSGGDGSGDETGALTGDFIGPLPQGQYIFTYVGGPVGVNAHITAV